MPRRAPGKIKTPVPVRSGTGVDSRGATQTLAPAKPAAHFRRLYRAGPDRVSPDPQGRKHSWNAGLHPPPALCSSKANDFPRLRADIVPEYSTNASSKAIGVLTFPSNQVRITRGPVPGRTARLNRSPSPGKACCRRCNGRATGDPRAASRDPHDHHASGCQTPSHPPFCRGKTSVCR